MQKENDGRNGKLQVQTATHCSGTLSHKMYNSHIHPSCLEAVSETVETTSPCPGCRVVYCIFTKENNIATFPLSLASLLLYWEEL